MSNQRVVTIEQYRETLDKAPPSDEFDSEKIRASAEQEKGSTHVLFWVDLDGPEPEYRREYFGSFEAALAQANENKGIVTQ